MMGIYILFLSFSFCLPSLVFSFLNYPLDMAIVSIYPIVGAYAVIVLRKPVIIINDKFRLPDFKAADELFFNFHSLKKDNYFFASDFEKYFELKQKCNEFETKKDAYNETDVLEEFKFFIIYIIFLGLFIKKYSDILNFVDFLIYFAICLGFIAIFCFFTNLAFKKYYYEFYTVYHVENCSEFDEAVANPKDYFSEDGKTSYFRDYIEYEHSRCYDLMCQRIKCLREASIYVSETQSKEMYISCFLPVIVACLLRLL